MLKRFRLKYSNCQMEEEYFNLKQQTNTENIQMSFYFIIFLLLIPGIPAAVEQNYIDVGITVATAIVLCFIFFCKIIPRKYIQFLAGLIISAFDFCMLLMTTSHITTSSKGLMFFRGYAFASVNVVLLSLFANMKQKIFFLVFNYAFRFTLVILLDIQSVQIYTIIRHVYIDLFALYVSFYLEKRERIVFKRFHEHREELTKFKELLAEYLPQAITVIKNFADKPLFSNRSFTHTFDQSEFDGGSTHSHMITTLQTKPLVANEPKNSLRLLKVNKESIEEGIYPFSKGGSGIVYLKDLGESILRQNLLDSKSVSVTATQRVENENRSFEVVLKKVKWDGEDAIAVILNDITHQENLLRLKIADSNKDKIIATISHELRTPLNGIIGILEMVEKKVVDPHMLEYVELCKDNAYLLLSLVNSLLDLQQFKRGKLRLNPMKVKVARVIKDVMRLFLFQCNKKGLSLKYDIEEGVPSCIITDEHRLKQIMVNLVGNALKFTSQGGIRIRVSKDLVDGDLIQISIKDTGIGIKEEDKSRLFKMYDGDGSVNANGAGIGLTISNTLAGILGGKTEGVRAIDIISKSGEGSQFIFSILKDLKKGPTDKDAINILTDIDKSLEKIEGDEEYCVPMEYSRDSIKPSPSMRVKKYVSSQLLGFPSALFLDLKRTSTKANILPYAFSPLYSKDNSPRKTPNMILSENETPHLSAQVSARDKGCILVVDDNPFNLLVAENIIKDLGYSYQTAKSGLEAIEIVKNRGNSGQPSFQIILMDCQMPIMDGYETTKILREMMGKREVAESPIIALTANNGEEDIKKCFESGMVDHISKPLFANALLKAIAALG